MANVYINNNKLIPAPFYGISHEINRSGDGDILSCSYSIVLTGSIVCNRGSPDSTGTFGTDSDETASIFSSPDRFKSMLQNHTVVFSILHFLNARNAQQSFIYNLPTIYSKSNTFLSKLWQSFGN